MLSWNDISNYNSVDYVTQNRIVLCQDASFPVVHLEHTQESSILDEEKVILEHAQELK